MSTAFDKSSVGAETTQYATRLKAGDVGKYVLLPGDPDRVGRIARYLEDAKEVAYCREFRTATGVYKGITVSATSTGVGCPSASMMSAPSVTTARRAPMFRRTFPLCPTTSWRGR
jgi:uridine phosphorylase